MTVLAPPKPPPPEQEDLEALIEEARRRARRRRVTYLVTALVALVIVGAIWAALALTGGGHTAAGTAPPGFQLVQAKGPVAHQLIQRWGLPQPTSIDLATGREHAAKTTSEIWFDPKSGLAREVDRIDGRVQSDRVETCGPLMRGGPCVPAFSFAQLWPVDSHLYAREPGTGLFRGHQVLWIGVRENTFPPAPSEGQHIALDARTHETVGTRGFLYGTRTGEDWVQARRKDIRSDRFSFAVPEGGFSPGFPRPMSRDEFSVRTSTPLGARERRALGRTPVWLGPRFRGQRLRSVSVGIEALQTQTGSLLRPVKFVRYAYGNVWLEEFGSKRPAWYEQGPPPGRVVLERQVGYLMGPNPHRVKIEVSGQRAAVSRGGLLVIMNSHPLKRARVIALAKALRPIPRSSR